MLPNFKSTTPLLQASLACLAIILLLEIGSAQAGQGCPFDDGSCQEYCQQQGCNMGYCGHFAWIQCICRKCGDEWSWYDKVRYNPNKQVNQTELDSLKLNRTAPLILSGGNVGDKGQIKQQQQVQKPEVNKPATLTTLLIPDLSESNGKLDLNDIPDENSDKFLDYLAKNHEKLVLATSARRLQQQQQQQASTRISNQQASDDDDEDDEGTTSTNSAATTTTTTPTTINSNSDDDTIEIQISSSNNNSNSNNNDNYQSQQGQPLA